MKNFRQTLGILIASILLFFLIRPFIQARSELQIAYFQAKWQWIVLSYSIQFVYRSLYTYPFSKLLSSFMNKCISFRVAFTLFHLANITRYLPGRIWGVVRLLSLSQQFGLRRTAAASSLTVHIGVETILGGLIATPLLFSKNTREVARTVFEKGPGYILILTIVMMVIVVISLFYIPQFLTRFRVSVKTLAPIIKSKGFWVDVILGHSLLWICQGIAFYMFVHGFSRVPWTDAGNLTACFSFAWIVGFLSFMTPGGLGIREGLLGLLLTNYMPGIQAKFIALLCRLWSLSVEILLAVIAFCGRKVSKARCP